MSVPPSRMEMDAIWQLLALLIATLETREQDPDEPRFTRPLSHVVTMLAEAAEKDGRPEAGVLRALDGEIKRILTGAAPPGAPSP